jgi:tetratricopeptide (TPR) repeat protein
MIGDRTRAARQFMKLGTVHYRRNEIEAALDAAEKARGLFDADASLFLRAGVQYNLAHYLHAAGKVDEAEAELADHHDLLEAAGEWMAFYVAWLRARIAWSRGDLRRAEALFRETRSRAIARGIAFDTSLVSLELALVHLAQGRTGLVKRLAREALRVFADQEVEREVLAALELIEVAARREDLTREMIEKAVVFLESARHARRESSEPS